MPLDSSLREKSVPATSATSATQGAADDFFEWLRVGPPPAGDAGETAESSAPVGPPKPPPVLLADLAPAHPDPTRLFWWFSSTPLPDRRIPAGLAVPAELGSRLPPEADYWCHEGDTEWTRVDHAGRPKPAPRPAKPKYRPKHKRVGH